MKEKLLLLRSLFPNKSSCYKAFSVKRLLLLIIAVLNAVPAISMVPPSISTTWQKAGESKRALVVLYKVENCNGQTKVLLALQNASDKEEIADFYLQIQKSNDSEESVTQIISQKVPGSKIVSADCAENTESNKLSIPLPEGYNPSKVQIKAIFRFE